MKPAFAVLARAVGLVCRGSNVDCFRGGVMTVVWSSANSAWFEKHLVYETQSSNIF